MHRRQGNASSMEQAQGPEDDWSGLSSAQRRQIQNRLNQRAYRQRKAEEKVRAAGGVTAAELFDRELNTAIQEEHPDIAPSSSYIFPAPGSSSSLQHYHAIVNQISADHLHIPMIRERLYAGLFSNATILGISIASLSDPTLGSPFVSPEAHSAFSISDWYPAPNPANLLIPGPSASSNFNMMWTIPQPLQPSSIQQLIPHHAYIDLYPSAKIRDNLIFATEIEDDFDEAGLCIDAMCGEKNMGVMVWGDPSITDSYELGEAFVRKWWKLLKGCDDLLAATNKWRDLRGDNPIIIEEEEEVEVGDLMEVETINQQGESSGKDRTW